MDHTRYYSTRVVCYRDVEHVGHTGPHAIVPPGELGMDGGDSVRRNRDEFKLVLT